MANQTIDISVSGLGNHQVVAGIAGQSVYMTRVVLTALLAVKVRFTDGPGGSTVCGPFYLTAGVPLVLATDSFAQWAITSPGNDLTLNSDSAVSLGGQVGYTQF
jgi:hypothetical protein